jgi:hypothetical protein
VEGFRAELEALGLKLAEAEVRAANWFLRLHVRGEGKRACLHVIFNKAGRFQAPAWIRQKGDSEALLKQAEEAWVKSRAVVATHHRNRCWTPVFPENRSYLKELFELVEKGVMPLGVRVAGVEHLPYTERYYFARGPENAVFDFFYNGQGQFSKMYGREDLGNAPGLAAEIKARLEDLFAEEAG